MKNNNFIKIILIVLWILFFIENYITIYKLYLFIIISSIIIIHSRLLKFIDDISFKNKKIKIKNKKIIYFFLFFFLFLDKWKNPLLYFIYLIEKKMFSFLKILNYKLINILSINNRRYLQILLLSLITSPFNLIFIFFYRPFLIWKNLSIVDIFFKRLYGLILSVLIFTDIIKIIMNLIHGYEIIYIYIFLVIISFLIDLGYLKFLKIENLSVVTVSNLRSKVVLTSLIKMLLLSSLKKSFTSNFMVDKKYIYSVRSNCLYGGFLNFWEEHKITALHDFDMLKEVTNKPSFFIYNILINWIGTLGICTEFPELVYYKFKWEELNDEERLVIDYLYKVDELKIRLLLYMIWDIDAYIGNNEVYIKVTSEMSINSITVIESNYNNPVYFTIEDKTSNLSAYDPDINCLFFEKLYEVISKNPINPFYFEYTKSTTIYRRNKQFTENFMYSKFIRPFDLDIEEGKALPFCEEFLKKLRSDWIYENSIRSIKERNLILLNELEFIIQQDTCVNVEDNFYTGND